MCNMAGKVKKKLRQTPKYILKKIANISAIVILLLMLFESYTCEIPPSQIYSSCNHGYKIFK